MSIILGKLFRGYYFLRERLPIFLYLVYRYYEKQYENNKKIIHIEFIICSTIVFVGSIFGLSLIGYYSGLSFNEVFQFKWQYSGIITWSIFFFIYFIGIYYKTGNTLKAYIISILASLSGGWLYEISIFKSIDMYLLGQAIFYVKGQIICIILLIYEYWRLNIRRNKFNSFCFILYLVLSILTYEMGIYVIYPKPYNWFYRIPTVLFLFSLISGIEKK